MIKKSTIYLELEDDITAIIDKIRSADADIVAVVPPKRMPALQSLVNLKLVKKTATAANKRVVLVTSEASLLPLVGSVGLHIAESLQSRPYIPDKPDQTKLGELVIEEANSEDTPDTNSAETLSETSEGKPLTPPHAKTVQLQGILPRIKGSIPNFSKFRLKLILSIIAGVVLIIAWFFAYVVMPKAEISVVAQTSRVPVVVNLVIDPSAASDNVAKKTLVPIKETLKKSFKDTGLATGEKNVGDKATGTMTIKNCNSSNPIPIPAGTVFAPSSGKRFKTDVAIDVPGGNFTDGDCSNPGEAPVDVTATGAGASYNLDSAGYSAPSYVDVTGVGGQMTGGTDVMVTVVSQDDVDKLAETLEKHNHEDYVDEIVDQFDTSIVPIENSFSAKKNKPSAKPAVGDEADEFTVTQSYTYTMQGVSADSLSEILTAAILKKHGDAQATLYGDGVKDATLTLNKTKLKVEADGFVGPELDKSALIQEIAGKKFSVARDLLLAKNGVTSVEIKLSPFWVFSVPKAANHITLTIDVSEHALQNTSI